MNKTSFVMASLLIAGMSASAVQAQSGCWDQPRGPQFAPPPPPQMPYRGAPLPPQGPAQGMLPPPPPVRMAPPPSQGRMAPPSSQAIAPPAAQPMAPPPPPPRYGYRDDRRWSPWRDGFDFDRRVSPWDKEYWDEDYWDSEWGPFDAFFDGMGDADFEFHMSGSFETDTDIDADNRGRMYHYGYHGYHDYGPPPGLLPPPYMMPPPVMPPAPQPAPAAPVAPAPAEPVPAAPESTDDDMDGVLNVADYCPDSAVGAAVDAFGCETTQAIVLRGVNFVTNSDELTEESVEILDRVSATLNAHQELKLEVAGHTDSDGDDAYNKDLSQRRAQTVRNYLVDKGANADNLSAAGYGEEQPIATNETAEGKAQNRRVELNRL